MPNTPLFRTAAAVLACLSLAYCTDGSAPTDLASGAPAFVLLSPVLDASAEANEVQVQRIRITARNQADGTILAIVTQDVDPTQSQWELALELDLDGSLQVVVDIELIELVSGVEQVVWSGRAGPFQVAPGQNVQSGDVKLYQGGLSNLSVTAVEIGAGPLTVVEGGEITLTATVQGAAGEATVFWSSMETGVATVTSRGVVTGVTPGAAHIVARAGPKADTASVTVQPRLAGVQVSPGEQKLETLGQKATYTAKVVDPRGAEIPGQTVTWSSRSSGVAQSVGGGEFEAVGNGSTWVIAEATSGGVTVRDSARLVVEQKAVSVTLEPTEVMLYAIDETAQFRASFVDAGGHPAPSVDVSWTSDAEHVAVVDTRGIVTATGNGFAVVTVRGQGLEASAGVTVEQRVASVEVTPDFAEVHSVGEVVHFSAEAWDSRGNPILDATLTWSAGDPRVATVDQTGLATAVSGGRTSIDATAGRIRGGADLFVDLPLSSHRVYVSNTESDDITFIDLNAGTAEVYDCSDMEASCSNPRNLQVNHAGTLVAVPFRHSDEIGIFDPSVPGFVRVLWDSSFDEPYAVAFTPDDREIWVANKRAGSVSIIDVSTWTVVQVISDARIDSPEGIFVGGGNAFVANKSGASLSIIDVASRAFVHHVVLPDYWSEPRDVVATPDGQWAYVTTDGSRVYKVRVSDGTATMIPTSTSRNITMSPDGTKVYTGNSIIDVATDQVQSMDVGWGYGLTILRDGSYGFSTYDGYMGSVRMFDPVTGAEITNELFPLSLGRGTRGITSH